MEYKVLTKPKHVSTNKEQIWSFYLYFLYFLGCILSILRGKPACVSNSYFFLHIIILWHHLIMNSALGERSLFAVKFAWKNLHKITTFQMKF